ncbi:alkaline phosphatase [Sphingomonas sp. PAMC26645]|uniref:alkaline phosphatase D family protein n=1 Tax=Sphingomonas sp. PAMC26645 TaxID=2565555 RepID=UPI00109DF989|nr:alkaline phosphatase D family protein [Sphingomonas sp. PAMC26645]QCB43675.1 alkaline phosphatase [Sphingomonas sp. PAMC26645]
MLTRRTIIGAAAAAPALLGFGRAGALTSERLFSFGVASGDPTPNGVVLWTRLAARPLAGDGGMGAARVPVRWEIYDDDSGRHLVRAGDAVAEPAWGHSVHVEVSGLQSGRPYWYRFIAGGEASAIGRTRTAPARHALPERLRFCFGSCQKYEDGQFGAWANTVAEDPDLIVFLGDYIYEEDPSVGTPRVHLNPAPVDLDGYRVRYATYRLDPLLQAAHAVAPWIVTWDDHEVINDYADLADQHNSDPAVMARRRAAAYQAYYEFMPLRAYSRPHGPDMRLYRTLDWGRLAQFQVLDDRQYRSPRGCQSHVRGEMSVSVVKDCPDLHDPKASILGMPQEKWLLDTLSGTKARWNILTQQTQITPYPRRDPAHPDGPADMQTVDTWQGYQASRNRIFARWQDANVSNPLVIGGDIHAFVASDISYRGKALAPCFVGGSITTQAGDKLLVQNTADLPAYRFARNDVRGYGRIDVTPTQCDVAFRALRNPLDARTEAYDLTKYVVEDRRPRMQAA